LSFDLSYGLPFLTEKLFISFSGIPGRSISKVSSWLLTIDRYFYHMGIYPLLPIRQTTTLPSVENPMLEPRWGEGERNNDGKWYVWREWTMKFHRPSQWKLILKGDQLTRESCHPPRYEQVK
jgi:hypothetical protein